MLINSGQSILQVQSFLGHKKASTTLDIYSHVYLEGKRQTAAKIDELLG
jgi:site-specific recombinase XerD